MYGIVLMACVARIDSAFEDARDHALSEAGPAPAGWAPDAAVLLSESQLTRLLGPLIDHAFDGAQQAVRIDGPLGTTARLKPLVDLDQVAVHGGAADRAEVSLSGSGSADWTLGPASGSLPFTWTVRGTWELALTDDPSLSLSEVRSASLTVKGRKLQLDATDGLEAWLADWATTELPSLPLGTLGGEDLPVRAMRIRGLTGGLAVELLTDAAHGGALAALTPPDEGLQVQVAQETLLDLARRKAFQEGPVADGTWIEPTGLAMTGDAWTLQLRVWRLAPGWWRDYTVSGRLVVEQGEVRAEAQTADETARSQGAAFAEPLALLATGQVLQGIVDAADYALPAKRGLKLARRKAIVRVDSAHATDTAWILEGAARWKRTGK